MEPHSTHRSDENLPKDAPGSPDVIQGGTPSNSIDSALLDRYWLGETTSQESELVEAWLADNPVWKTRYSELRYHLKEDTSRDWKPLSQIEVHNSIDKVLSATGLKDGNSAKVSVNDRSRAQRAWKQGRPFASIGLALVCLMAIGFGWIYSTSKTIPSAAQTYTTGIGQRITVTLSDGTNVTLAPQSALNIPEDFGSDTRNLTLNGEAYFDVSSADRVPFIVKAGNTSTRVLGTRFVVKHYETDPSVWVAVESGKVSVGEEKTETKGVEQGISETVDGKPLRSTILTPGQVAIYDGLEISVSSRDDLADYTDWLHSRLTFRSAPLDEALETLTRWYGVNFNVSDSRLRESRITGSLPYGSLEDMLKTLKDLLDVSLTYERGDDGTLGVTLHPVQNDTGPLRRENRFSLPTAFNR